MRVPGLVLMLSLAALGDAGAGDMPRNQQVAQASSPSGSCMPIGVTAAGELVFPWECREVIERERGPVSLDLSMPPKTAVSSQTVSSQSVSKQSVSNQPASNPLAASEPTVGKTAAASDGAKKQPSTQATVPEPEHVATIPGGSAPPPAGPTLEPMDHHSQVKRLASGRRQSDPRAPRSAIQPSAPPKTRLPSPPG
jgi:hypothetical protein